MVHAMKRMRISRSLAHSSLSAELKNVIPKRKTPSGRQSPMIVIQETPSPATLRKQKMVEMLHSQLRAYKAEYQAISEGQSRISCAEFPE
jgi:hypothetical protein